MKRTHALLISLALASRRDRRQLRGSSQPHACRESAEWRARGSGSVRAPDARTRPGRSTASRRLRRRPPAIPPRRPRPPRSRRSPSRRRSSTTERRRLSTSSIVTAASTITSTSHVVTEEALAVAAMTSHVARLYALVAGVLAFFVAWAAVAAHPWSTAARASADPRLAALSAREQQIRLESIRVQKIVALRWAVYRRALAAHNAAASKATARRSAVAARRGAFRARRQPAPTCRDPGVVMLRRNFRAMGTDIELVVDAVDADESFAAAEAEFERLEQVMSRFRPSSELSRLNDAAQIDASPDLARGGEPCSGRSRSHEWAVRPHDSRRARRGWLRPHLRRRCRRRPGRDERPGHVRRRGRSRALADRRSSPAYGSTSAASARDSRPSGLHRCLRLQAHVLSAPAATSRCAEFRVGTRGRSRLPTT